MTDKTMTLMQDQIDESADYIWRNLQPEGHGVSRAMIAKELYNALRAFADKLQREEPLEGQSSEYKRGWQAALAAVGERVV